MKKKYLGLIVVFIILAVICITAGVTYAVFNYRKEGKVDNVITSGKITFRYDEDSVNGIDLQNAIPMKNYEGSELSGEGQVFDFTISSEGSDEGLFYEINLETTEDSTLDPSIVNTYITIVDEDGYETTPCYFGDDVIQSVNDFYSYGYIRASSEHTEIHYRLRIWIDKEADFSPLKNEDGTYQEDENGNYIYPYNNQTFKLRVNVSASSGFVGDAWCQYSDNVVSSKACTSGGCFIGYSLTLADNSTWKIIDYDFSQNTISLIYDHYIDEEGNYDIAEVNTYTSHNINLVDIDAVLNNFASKIKNTLHDDSILVLLPNAKMNGINITLNNSYYDVYFLGYAANKFSKSNYILSDCYDIDGNYHYIVGNGKISKYFSWIDSAADSEKIGIKPVITISNNYIPSDE